MNDDGNAVACETDVELDSVSTGVDGGLKRGDSVFWSYGRRAAVANNQWHGFTSKQRADW